jgi:hypothetical protein
MSKRINLEIIPEGWYLYSLKDIRRVKVVSASGVGYREDHSFRLRWLTELQHETGGKLCIGEGRNPQESVFNAVNEIRVLYPYTLVKE